MPTSVSLGGSRAVISLCSLHQVCLFVACWSRPCSWQGSQALPTPCWLLSGPGAGMEVTEDAVLEASHSVRGCGCFWVSHSGRVAGPEGEGAWSPQTLHHGSREWAAHRCRCLSVAAVAAAACPGDEEAAWGETLMGGLSSPHSCFLGVPQAGRAGLGW